MEILVVETNSITKANKVEDKHAQTDEFIDVNMEKNKRLKKSEEESDMLKHLRNETVKLFLKAFQTQNKWIKLYLIALLLVVSGTSSYMLVDLITSYLNYDVITTSQLYDETPAVFPRVTICNYNPFQTAYAAQFLAQVNAHISPNVSFFDAEQVGNLSSWEVLQLASKIYAAAWLTINGENFTDAQRKSLAHDANDVIFACQYNYFACEIATDFVRVFDNTFGNCFVFNSAGPSWKTADVSSSSAGLNLNVYVNFHANLSLFNDITGGLGAVVRIENNSYLVDNSLVGSEVHLAPGMITSIKVSRTFKVALERPFSNCDVPNDDSASESFLAEYPLYRLLYHSAYQYTRETCFVQCYQSRLGQECLCVDSYYLSLLVDKGFCLTEAELNCSAEFWQDFDWNECLDSCPLECNQTVYAKSISSVNSLGHYNALLIGESPNLASDFGQRVISAEMTARSFVGVSVFYETLSYALVTEAEKMDIVGLLAGIGGNLGLFLGVSIFSFCEIIEIVLELYFIRRK